jgi:hypothetical protein
MKDWAAYDGIADGDDQGGFGAGRFLSATEP